jgi:CreA protein
LLAARISTLGLGQVIPERAFTAPTTAADEPAKLLVRCAQRTWMNPACLEALMKHIVAALVLLLLTPIGFAEQIGAVSTRFKLVGPNDKIVVEVFDDPHIAGAACYLSRARTGGVSGAIGVAEDTADASIACRQIGPIVLPANVLNGELDGDEVFKKRISLVFKSLQVVRFYDARRNVLVYLTYSDRVIEGSPKNSLSVVPIVPWPRNTPATATLAPAR